MTKKAKEPDFPTVEPDMNMTAINKQVWWDLRETMNQQIPRNGPLGMIVARLAEKSSESICGMVVRMEDGSLKVIDIARGCEVPIGVFIQKPEGKSGEELEQLVELLTAMKEEAMVYCGRGLLPTTEGVFLPVEAPQVPEYHKLPGGGLLERSRYILKEKHFFMYIHDDNEPRLSGALLEKGRLTSPTLLSVIQHDESMTIRLAGAVLADDMPGIICILSHAMGMPVSRLGRLSEEHLKKFIELGYMKTNSTDFGKLLKEIAKQLGDQLNCFEEDCQDKACECGCHQRRKTKSPFDKRTLAKIAREMEEAVKGGE